MAEVDFGEYRDPDVSEGRVQAQSVLNALGAAISLALVLGIGIWGYKLMVRDVSGVPVVRALEGPMRVAPQNPGGAQAAYQGLAVNTVAAEGQTASLPETVVLAPSPLSLAEEDLPVPELARHAPAVAPAPREDGGVLTVSFNADAAVAAALADIEVLPGSVPGLSRSLRPRQRPASDLVARAAAATPMASDAGQVREIDPSGIPSGTRLVQLGAYDDVETARAEWDRIARRFSAHMETRDRVIEAAMSGGRTFYRLRVHGFADEAEARRFCAVLLAENADCIPVLIR